MRKACYVLKVKATNIMSTIEQRVTLTVSLAQDNVLIVTTVR